MRTRYRTSVRCWASVLVLFMLAGLFAGISQPGPLRVESSEGKETLEAADEGGIFRIYGQNRYHTAAKVAGLAQTLHGDIGSEVVILARGDGGDDYVDGLSGSLMTAAFEAPILLTRQHSLPAETEQVIRELGAATVVILGGEGAISSSVELQLQGMGLETRRVDGRNRYETAATIAYIVDEVRGDMLPLAFIVSGTAPADAMVVGVRSPIGYPDIGVPGGIPILQVRRDSIPQVTREALEELGIESAVIIGGNAVVSQGVEAELESVLPDVWRVAGEDRYGTSYEMWDEFGFVPDPHDPELNYIFVRGSTPNLADAIGAGYLGSLIQAPILYTYGDRLPGPIEEMYAGDGPISYVTLILGGPNAVGKPVEQRLRELRDADPRG